MNYWMRSLIAIDQLVNVMVFWGEPDETLSARSYRLRSIPFWGCMRLVLDALFFWQESHCRQCYEWEQDRRDLPEEYRPGSFSI